MTIFTPAVFDPYNTLSLLTLGLMAPEVLTRYYRAIRARAESGVPPFFIPRAPRQQGPLRGPCISHSPYADLTPKTKEIEIELAKVAELPRGVTCDLNR